VSNFREECSLIAKTGTYHDQVQEKVRRDDPAQPLFLLANIYRPSRDQKRAHQLQYYSLSELTVEHCRQLQASYTKCSAESK
jgi:hypothetical protein